MRHFLLVGIAGLFLTACQWFSTPGYIDRDGVFHPAKTGIIDQVAGGAAASGLPYGTAAAALLGVAGAIGTWAQTRSKRKMGAAKVELLDTLKSHAADLSSDEDVEKLVVAFSEKNPSFGKYLKRAWERARSL